MTDTDTNPTLVSNTHLAKRFIILKDNLAKHIIGQDDLISKLIIALLSDGHLLVEGAPGLAKTKAVKTLSQFIEGSFQRIQFTPDLLPTDITGTEIFRPQTGEFIFEHGPIFNNLILADEINRAPAKAQSALLEAMGERQVTIGRKTYQLPHLFLVMATQNPIEQHGTYQLPEAQLDRFLLHVNVDYPNLNTEREILRCVQEETKESIEAITHKHELVSTQDIITARRQILDVHISEPLEQYLIHIILATRNPEKYFPNTNTYIQYGASPRATIALARTARTVAWLDNRDYVIPEDIKSLAPDILRHRLILTYLAEAEHVNKDDCIKEILTNVPVP
ncbi:MAG: MoxR family ATPase [Gammaproteobacteria bacterium]|nr:MoxR family ATPase [Gammaproteobacteria bacterium]